MKGRPVSIDNAYRILVTVDKAQYDQLKHYLGKTSFANFVREAIELRLAIESAREM